MGVRFSGPLLKSKLEIAIKRMQGQCNKKNNNIKIARREIAKLLQEKKDESARIRVEAVLHEIHLVEAMEIISLMCQLLSARVALLASEKYVPDDLIEASASIIFCAKRLQIPELIDIAKLFASKFGEEWVKLHVNNQAEKVNVRILDKMGVKPPEFDVVINYLHDVAKQYGVAWEPNFVEPKDNNSSHYAMGSIAPLNFNELKAEVSNEVFRPGTLNLLVHEARKLYATRMFGSMDPYCLLTFTQGKAAPVQYRTRWEKNSGVLLVFHNEYFPFAIKEPGQKIKLEIWDKNALIDDFIGSTILDVDTLIQTPQQTYYKLTRGYDGKTEAGEVAISTQFMPYHPNDDDEEKNPVVQQFPGAPAHIPAVHFPVDQAVPNGYNAHTPVPAYPTAGGPAPTPQSPPPGMYFPSVPGMQAPPPPQYDDSMYTPPPKGGPASAPAPAPATNGPPDVDELEARFRALQS